MDQETPTYRNDELTSVEELKRLELRFLMADDEKISKVLEVIFVDILRKFFELDVLEVRSLEATEKIKTLVSICNHIRDRILTSGNKIKIPMKQILEFMIVGEFVANIHLNKIIQLYLQEVIYEMCKNALLQNAGNKIECAGLLFQAFMGENLTVAFQHKLFFLFVYWVPKMAKEFKDNLTMVGFPQILVEEGRIQKLNQLSIYLLDYYNFLDSNSGLKTKINQFKEEVIQKDTDPTNIKFGVNKMNLNDALRFLQLNMIDFLGTVFSMHVEPDKEPIAEEEAKEKKSEEKAYPSHSYKIIPVLILSTASLISEVNEKAKHILKSFERHSDMDHSSAEAQSAQSQSSEHDVDIEPEKPVENSSGLNATSVWAEIMKFYLNTVRNSMQNNLARFDEQIKKSIILYTRNLKRNVLEYALKCEVTAKLPQLLTAINDQGQIRLLGLKFVDHMITHLFVSSTTEISKTNARTIYTLLSKIIPKEGFLTPKEKSLAYQSLIEVILKCPELLEINKKDSLELMDEAFNEFKTCSETEASKDNETYANWIKCLGRMKLLFQNSSKKGFVIVKMKERIENIINNYGIDDDRHSMNIFIWLNWIEFLCGDRKFPFNLMYISVILSHANDLKIKDKATLILEPLLRKLQDRMLIKEKSLSKSNEESKEADITEEHHETHEEAFETTMFIKKASQYQITSMKGFQIAEQLCSISLTIFQLLESDEARSSLQSCLETRILELFSKPNQAYSQLHPTLKILRTYLTYLYKKLNSQICNDISDYYFLFPILQTCSSSSDRKLTFEIMQILLTKGGFSSLYQKCLSYLEDYNYGKEIEYGVEEHSTICNLTVLLLMAHVTGTAPKDVETEFSGILKRYYSLCNEFNKISNYKHANLEKINNFAYSFAKLAEVTNLRKMSDEEKCSEAFDDLVTKLMEIVDNKELTMELRKSCVEEYLMRLYMHTDEYLDHVKYLREQYLEYDQYELHQSIGISASQLLKQSDLEGYFSELQNCINGKESTLIAKRASIVHLAEFILNSDLVKNCQEQLTQFQGVFFKYIFDKKEVIQECASNVLTKLYQLGDAETRKRLVKDLTRALGGSQTLTHMQEKEEDFELNIEYKPSTEDSKKLKTFKELWDIAHDIGHNELIYQFLNIHRHLNHYKNIKKAAESLHGILLEDPQVKADLLSMTPKIFLMTYDYNEEIRDTMKEVMSVLVPPDEENLLIKNKWDEIIKELFEGINNQKEFRKRLAGLHAMSDIIYKEDWTRVKQIFEKLFNVSFKLIDDVNDNVKQAALNLLKTLKKVTLRNGNIYTCTNLTELKEIYAIVLPLVLQKGIISHLSVVKFYSVNLLFDILETSKEESVVDKLKVKGSREDRQLNYTYNSKQKMREVMKPYLKDIIVLIIECISEFESELWNKVEMEVAASKGKGSDLDHMLNDMRIKSSKDSMLYEILANCKDLLTEEALDETIPELIKIIKKGVGISTRAGACNFIIESSIERPELFKLKFAKKVFKSCIDILANANSCKESLLKIVCRLGGSLFRVLSKSFKALQDALDQVNEKLCSSVDKYDELIGFGIDKYWIAYLLIVREAIRNMKDLDLSQDRGALIEQVIPYIFAMKNNVLEDETKREQIAKLGSSIFKDIFDNRISIPVEAFEDVILTHIKALLDSSNFMVRTNGVSALADLCQHIDDYTILQKLNERKIIDLLINKTMSGKFFTEYIDYLRQILDFGVGGEQGKYVRPNATLLESVVEKLTTKMSNQVGKSDTDLNYRKGIVLLLNTVARIQLHLIRLEYDTPKDAEKVEESRKNLFETLFNILEQSYGVDSKPSMQVDEEESKDPNIVIQPDSKNKDIRSVNKEVFEFHQLVIEALSNFETPEYINKQFELYKSMYFSVSWEIRLGILKNLDTLFHVVTKTKHWVEQLVSENSQLESFLKYLVEFTRGNGEKYDSNLLHLSRVLNTLVQSLQKESELRALILESIEDIFALKIKEDKRNKKREKQHDMDEVDDEGAVRLRIEAQHELLKQENRILTEMMQNYYLMKNSK